MVFTDKELTLKTPNTLYLSLRSILNKADVHICRRGWVQKQQTVWPLWPAVGLARLFRLPGLSFSSMTACWRNTCRNQTQVCSALLVSPSFIFNDISWTCKCLLITVLSADPAPVQLIIQFLEQASKPSVNEQNQVQPPADNRRNRTLKLLALKVAAHMKWDLEVLEKGWVRVF